MPGQDVLQIAMALCNQRAGGRFDDVCRPMVSTAQPAAVRLSAQQLRAKLLVLVNLLTQLQASRDGLMKVWSSQSAATAGTALANAFSTFQKTIDAATRFIHELEGSADQLDTAMGGTSQAVDQSEPRIAAFLANPQPASQQAARAMAFGTTAQTSGFLNGQRAALTASAGSINSGVLGGLAGILNSINQLMGGGQQATATPALPAAPAVTSPPGTDQSYLYGYPAAAPAGPSGHLVRVAFNADGSVADVQSDLPVDVRVDEMTAAGQHVVKDITVGADGRTTTTTTTTT